MPAAAKAHFERGADAMRERIALALHQMGKPDAEELSYSVLAEMVGAIALARLQAMPDLATRMLASCRSALKARLDIGHNNAEAAAKCDQAPKTST